MSPVQTRAFRPSMSVLSMLALLTVLAVVLFAALRSPLKDDIAWLLYVARRWMAGRELYVDLVEVNPPMIVWISVIPLTVSRWLNISPQYVAMPGFVAVVLACSWWSACLLRTQGALFAARAPVFAVIGSVLLIIPAADLGQREHLLVAAFLPYLILFARTLDGTRPSAAASIAAGVLASLGCALKPQYGLAFAALELVALRHRVWPWRMAPFAAGIALAGYIALVAFLCPAYLRRAVPLALALYGATDVSFRALLTDSAPLLAAEALALVLWWRHRHDLPQRHLLLTGVVFAITSSVICFIDGKDWFYHRLPATVVTVLILILWSAAIIRHRLIDRPLIDRSLDNCSLDNRPLDNRSLGMSRIPRRGLAVAGIAVALFGVSAMQRLGSEMREAVEPGQTTVTRLEQLIRKEQARTYIAFSEWIALGFPVVNNTGVAWASRFDSMWALKGELWRARFDPTTAKEWPVARWVTHDFIAGCPDIAVVDTRGEGTNYVKVLSASEPAFARAWSRYRQIAAFDGLTIYRRGKGGCVDPWVAAEAPVGAPAAR